MTKSHRKWIYNKTLGKTWKEGKGLEVTSRGLLSDPPDKRQDKTRRKISNEYSNHSQSQGPWIQLIFYNCFIPGTGLSHFVAGEPLREII